MSTILLLYSILVSSCTTSTNVAALGKSPISDESQIKLMVIEHIATNALKSTNVILFVSVSEGERAQLVRKLPFRRIEPPSRAKLIKGLGVVDKASHIDGAVLDVGGIRITGQTADALGGYFSGASIRYIYKLEKKGHWRVVSVSAPIVMDPP